MENMKTLIVVLILMIFSFNSNGQLRITLNDTIVSCNKDYLQTYFYFNNSTDTTITLPTQLLILNDSDFGDIIYSIEKYDDDKKVFNKYRNSLDLPPIREIKYRYLKPDDFIISYFTISCLFNQVGVYRIRLELLTSKYNVEISNFISNWVEFKVDQAAR